MRRPAALASALIAGSLFTLHAQSQAPAQPSAPPPFRAGIDVVQLDVSVLDGNRQPVKGLTAADFTVLENGVTQPIVAFDAVDISDAAELPAPWMRTTAPDVATNDTVARRIVVIVFDDAHMPLDATKMAQRIARDVVERLGPEDLAAVTFTESGPRQDITSDRQRLLKSIDGLVPHPPRGRGLSICALRGRYRSRHACVIETFVNAGAALRAAPQGRKTLVWISAGAPFTFNMSDLRGENLPWGEEMLSIQAALKNLQQANINVYAVDPTGVTAAGIMGPAKDSLRMFSEDTGGRATMMTNTPWEAVPQMFRENSSYYMVAFQSTPPRTDGSFRKVQVKVSRPGVDVRARSGYYAPTAPNARTASRAAKETPLDHAISQGVPGGDLPLAATVAAFAIPGQRSAAVAVAAVLREPLHASGQTLEFGVMALDADCGDCRKLPSTRHTFHVGASAGAGNAQPPELLSQLTLPPGSYEIRIAATLDDRAGRVFAHLDVPDFQKARLSASGLILSTPGTPAIAQNDSLANAVAIRPTAVREFRPTTAVIAFLRIYQGGSKPPGAVRLTTTIVDAGNQTKLDQTAFLDSAQFSRTRSVDYRLDVPIAKLEAGAHLLTIEAHLGDLVVRRDATFTVR